MSYEIGQLDIPDRELLPARARPMSMSMEIGEAVVSHTIFGSAKVRIIRKHYSVRRTFWLTVMAVLAAAAAVASLEWIASQQAGTLQGADAAPSVSAGVQDAQLVQPENIRVPAAVLPTTNEPAPPQAGIGNPAITRQVAPQTAPFSDRPRFRRPSSAKPPAQAVTVPAAAQDSTEAVAPPTAPEVKKDASTPSPAAAGQAAVPARP